MKNLTMFFLAAILIFVLISCEKSNDPSKLPEFEINNEPTSTNVLVILFNTNDEMIIWASYNGIFLYNEIENRLKEVITRDKICNIQSNKISAGKSMIVHFHRDASQTLKS
jgi:hypothetical protein